MGKSIEDKLKDALNSVTNEDLQVIRKLKTIGAEYAMRGILSRLGIPYDEKTRYSIWGGMRIRYDKTNSDYKVITESGEDHIPVDGLIVLAKQKYFENIEEDSKGESNYVQNIGEKAKSAS